MDDSILTSMQREVLRALFSSGMEHQGYYLTGGTALAEFYLRHRFSDDLDVFTRADRNLIDDFEDLRPRLTQMNLAIDILQLNPQHITIFLKSGSEAEQLKLEFAKDVPARMAPPLRREGIVVDSFEDIAVNKICTILSRTEPKDACDLYFILKESKFTLDFLLDRAREKEVLFETEEGKLRFAANLLSLTKLAIAPRLIKAISISEMNQYLTELAQELLLRMRPRR